MPSPDSTASRLAALAAGESFQYLFFWGHTPAPDGSLTKSCFSQWWPASFTVDGATYPTAEHFMMAAKARLFGDDRTFQRILAAAHPKQAKQLGREVANFEEATWLRERFPLVVAGNQAKFAQNPSLRDFLLGTGDRVLVEASPVDRIWGIGLAQDDPHAQNPAEWRGLNLLGFALMQARRRLRESQA